MSWPFARAVVTGGAGFLGAHLCEHLLARGTAVVCVDDLSTGRASAVDRLRENPAFSFVRQDVSTAAVSGEVDLVLHLASPAAPSYYLRHPVATLRTGAEGTRAALALAQSRAARFVLASTSEVYGDPQQHPQPEHYRGNVDPVGPRSVYDEAKRYAEALTAAHQRHHGVNTAIARLFNTYGPGMPADDGRMVPTFARQALDGVPLTVEGHGRNTRSLCYVDDVVDGLLALAASEMAGPVNLGNPEERQVREIAETVLRVAGSDSPIQHVEAAADDPRRRCPDISLAERELGWRPRVGLLDGLQRTIAWYRQQRLPTG